ncbi:MAG: glycosyl transferase [Oscillatoriaceae bacterium SKW80]|nr:glycosyl transferase [Oscillatoriaceae bacterium SKYG93]MCX8120261.1 glycosyl transferase [Oscillatoriaceae bacterium SKW80]MDW8453187.1 glycosyl transferase [Oscillatoriaceae cyanobacterium SKYGB_i_bin93]HIK28901.1 glycosyl transferase [Oscillatoriaceae cyanobacterium M7585_C2015_266]
MSRPILYIAITNHGFGHAVRAACVAAAIQQMNPEILLILTTTAGRWLLEGYIPGDFILRQRAYDVGVIQSDSLTMDKVATLEKLKEIRKRQNYIIASEVNFLHLNRVGLILADIPPLAALIAKTAGIPCWMMSNFGWDFIYRAWGGEFMEIADWISECFSQCDRLFRLPFHEPMSAFPNITDVGLTGGTPRYNETDLKDKWKITAPKEKTVLLTFGGLGLAEIPYENILNFPDWQFITFDKKAPDLPNLIKIIEDSSVINSPHWHLRPVDFMPVCGRVISKPGYSTFAEATRLGVPIVSLTREDFAEAPLLLEGIQNYSYHQIITSAEFFEGNWDFLRREPQPPLRATTLATDGNEAIAQAVINYFSS